MIHSLIPPPIYSISYIPSETWNYIILVYINVMPHAERGDFAEMDKLRNRALKLKISSISHPGVNLKFCDIMHLLSFKSHPTKPYF